MIKPNWNTFKAKFHDNFGTSFEWFCYFLFCRQYKKHYGVFRYTNQKAIETELISYEDEVIGWQAKFYETKLSDNKKSLLKTIRDVKATYPTITKLLIYTNQEWGQGQLTTRKSIPLTEIENKAIELNLKLEWNTKSFFESPFVTCENEHISRYIFSLDKSIFDFVITQKAHAKNLLLNINCSINFNNQVIEISRKEILEKLKIESKKIAILSGAAGVGKTATIKSFYNSQSQTPFYLFKATEFAITSIEHFFTNCSLQDFIDFHSNDDFKIIVVDSSEGLLDLKNKEPFKEFFSSIRDNGWKIIFTVRFNFLQDLILEFIDNFEVEPQNLEVQNLKLQALKQYSTKYKFNLPENEKLIELIKNPFYLNEFLKFYKDGEKLDYVSFKNKLWNKIIKRGKPEREQCFLQIVREKSEKMQFFIDPICNAEILNNELLHDEILGHEDSGYFIVHDIYEEWALEKIIDREFVNKDPNLVSFFNKLGSSLSMRRSFRNWVSEKLLLEDNKIKSFIESVIENNTVEPFWKDSVLISVLLSKYSDTFFKIFKEELLHDKLKMLRKTRNLLLIACREINTHLMKNVDSNYSFFTSPYTLTKPSGPGWKSFIKFVYDNSEKIEHKNLNFILKIVHDWNKNTKKGKTTKYSSLLALKYYETCMDNDPNFSSEKKNEILETIVNGSSEIKSELREIFLQVQKNKWKQRGDKYYDLSKLILTSYSGIDFCKILPNHALKLADLFWINTLTRTSSYDPSPYDREAPFGIDRIDSNYYPASSFQTPVYWLLQFSLKETIDFILEFVNKSVNFFVKHNFSKPTSIGISRISKVEIYTNNKQSQYVNCNLWGAYRGIKINSYIFQSIHMALEKFLLEVGKNADPKILQNWLKYLLMHTISASITAVVTSIVLAFPEKTFSVAKILFKTKEFFLFDTWRITEEKLNLETYIAINSNLKDSKFHNDERLQSLKNRHRKISLENQFLYYQVITKTGQKTAEERQQVLWKIIDEYNNKLPNESHETTEDKTWQMYLTRMDARRTKITSETKGGNIIISFQPKVKPKLKEFSEEPAKRISKATKYIELNLWVNYKINNDSKYKEYSKYEKDATLVLRTMKEIISQKPPSSVLENPFYVFDRHNLAKISSILLKHNFQELSYADREFCKNIILVVASSPLYPNYSFQTGDGVEIAISTLPLILRKFPKEKANVKRIFLLALLDLRFKDGNAGFSIYFTRAIQDFWHIDFVNAQSLLFGFLFFKPKYDSLGKKIIRKLGFNHEPASLESELREMFVNSNKAELYNFYENKIVYSNLKGFCELDLSTLLTAFQLISAKKCKTEAQLIAKSIISVFAKKLNTDQSVEEITYTSRFLIELVDFVLHSQEDDIEKYLLSFLDGLTNFEELAELFQEFIRAEDKAKTYTNFWKAWYFFKRKVIEACQDKNRNLHIDPMVESYLFARTMWEKFSTDWHVFKVEKRAFFKEILKEIGFHPSVLFSISKLLSGIGAIYLDYGVDWIYTMLSKNENLKTTKLPRDTIYYLESFVKKYISNNQTNIRIEKSLKIQVVFILDFLVEKGSEIGYLAREKIL